MNPTDNSTQLNPAPISVTPSSPAPEKVGNPVPRTEKKFLLYGALIGVVVVVLVGIVGFYLMYAPKQTNNEVASVPVVKDQDSENETTPLEEASELDNLIVGLAQADGELDEELAVLNKDSDF